MSPSPRGLRLGLPAATFLLFLIGTGTRASAAPPPSGAHPRIFMSAANQAAFGTNAGTKGTSAAALVRACDDVLANPSDVSTRGGADGNNWPAAAVNCAFAYRVTGDAKYLAPALTYWRASLDDDQTIGDHLGCVAGVDASWQSWSGDPPAPPVILTVTHDTGYPMRWYGPDVALAYDWLYDAPGVDEPLRAQTRTCLGAWVDWYSAKGYHHDEAGANYGAGFVLGKVLAGIAVGTDGGSDGHLWTGAAQILSDVLVGEGLAGATGAVGTPAGVMVGGDWGEGWQYGPLSVLEYAVAARALEENGVPQPEMDAWTNSLATRLFYATVPAGDGSWVGGDFDDESVYVPPNVNVHDAVLAGPSSDTAAAWALSFKQKQGVKSGAYFYNALAELRAVTPQDFTAQTPPPPLWYLARGTRAMFVRTAWTADALWGVFSSAPEVVDDHEHFSASNFVMSRGADHLIVDPSNYGEPATFETNALSVDSAITPEDYTSTQTPFSQAELAYARGTTDAVYAARSDLTKAFLFKEDTDVTYAHREWVMLPEGEIVTIDRAHTAGAPQQMHVGFHTNTGSGGLTLAGAIAKGNVGGSAVAIQAVSLSGGAPQITQPEVGSCSVSCSYPCGQCDAARFAVDKYTVDVPGPWAVAVHVIDALAASGAPSATGSIGDDTYDPAPKQNAGVIGAAVNRDGKQSFVIASSAQDGASPATMTYGVPGTSASRHVVFDAPENADGKSVVAAVAAGDRCVLTITAGDGFPGRPLMFSLSTAADGCKPTAATDVAPGLGPPGGGAAPGDGAGPGSSGGVTTGDAASSDDGGCGCTTPRTTTSSALGLAALALLAAAIGARRSRSPRT